MRQESLRRVISICLLILLIAVFSLTSSYFLAPKNIFAFLRDASVTGIIAVGVTFVIITAGIDLSTGASRKSADLSGVHTDRIKQFAFGLSGFCCGLASIFLLARTGAATVELGTGLEFDVIAAVVVGGCAFSGGRGDVIGSMIGALFMAILTNGIYKYNLGSEYHVIIKGAVIIVMVLFDAVYQRYFQKRTQNSKQPAAEGKGATA